MLNRLRSKVIANKKLVNYYHTTKLLLSSTDNNSNNNNVRPKKPSDIEIMEIRSGKIVGIEKHPEAESLYIEQVDVGEETGPRTIVSGLVNYCSEGELLNKNVIVLCNLKPRPLKGVVSHGMLLCSSNEEHSKVEPLSPPDNTLPGELITFEGFTPQPVEPGNKATKAFGKIAKDFYVNNDGIATFNGTAFMTSQGPITATLIGPIS